MSVVYFMQPVDEPEGWIKIGVSTSLARRKLWLQSELGAKLSILGTIPGSFDKEREIHHRFGHLRIGRVELFRAGPDLLEFIRTQTQPWDGDMYIPNGSTIKVADDAYELARMAAKGRGESIAGYISRIVAESSLKDMEDFADELESSTATRIAGIRNWVADQRMQEAS